jgi:hypothetical protein
VIARTPRREVGSYWWFLGEAVASWYAKDGAALTSIRSAVENVLEVSGVHDDLAAIYGVAARIAVDFADRDLLDRLRQVVDGAGAMPPAGLRAHRSLLGALDPRDASAEETENAFRTALRDYDVWGSPVHSARASAAYGLWLARHGRAGEAEGPLARARATFADLGATAWLAELDAALAGQPA